MSEFYVIMHLLAGCIDANKSMKEQSSWIAEQASQRLVQAIEVRYVQIKLASKCWSKPAFVRDK